MACKCKCARVLALVAVVFLAVVAFLPDTQTYFGFDINLENKGVTELPASFSGPLLSNKLLNHAEHLFKHEVHGPEAFAIFNGKIYTGLGDGRIVEVLEDDLKTITQLDPQKVGSAECSKVYKHPCGRALGLRFDSRGTLYAVDPMNGVWTVNVATGETKLILDAKKHNALFLDDLVLLEKPNGQLVFYITDVSTRWGLYDSMVAVAEYDRTGRLLKYDTETKKLTVLYDKLAFPNGLELSDDKKSILMASITDRLVYKYHIEGPKKGQLEVLIENLPGEPDNVKRSADKSRETYWVAIYTARNKHKPHFSHDVVGKYGLLKRFFLRLQRLIGFVLEEVGKLSNCDCLNKIGFLVKLGKIPDVTKCEYGMAVEVDINGKIVSSLHSPDGVTCALSEVKELPQTEGQRHFLLGSATNNYLGRLSIPAKAAVSVNQKKPEQPKTPEPVVAKKVQQEKPAEPKAVPVKTSPTTPPPKKPSTQKNAGVKRDEL